MIWEELDERLIFINADNSVKEETDSLEILETAGEAFVRAGAAKPGYPQALIKREKDFPTGLDAGVFGIAIPHTESAWVIRNTTGILVMKEPVDFIKMGTEKEKIPVKLIFILAVKPGSDHMNRLKRIMSLIQDQELLSRIAAAENKKEIIEHIRKKEENL